MIRTLILATLVASAGAAAAQTPPPPVTRVLKSQDATSSGQPIVMPSGPLRVTASETVIPAHGMIRPHTV